MAGVVVELMLTALPLTEINDVQRDLTDQDHKGQGGTGDGFESGHGPCFFLVATTSTTCRIFDTTSCIYLALGPDIDKRHSLP